MPRGQTSVTANDSKQPSLTFSMMLFGPFTLRLAVIALLFYLASSSSLKWKKSPGSTPGAVEAPNLDQIPLEGDGVNKQLEPGSANGSVVLEIEAFEYLWSPFYTANVTFGNPPQPFKMLLDLTWGGAVTRSTSCGSDCGPRPFMYNSSNSSTSNDLGLNFGLPLYLYVAQGALFSDDMHLVSLQLPNVTVGALDTFYGDDWVLNNLGFFCDG